MSWRVRTSKKGFGYVGRDFDLHHVFYLTHCVPICANCHHRVRRGVTMLYVISLLHSFLPYSLQAFRCNEIYTLAATFPQLTPFPSLNCQHFSQHNLPRLILLRMINRSLHVQTSISIVVISLMNMLKNGPLVYHSKQILHTSSNFSTVDSIPFFEPSPFFTVQPAVTYLTKNGQQVSTCPNLIFNHGDLPHEYI